jgi:hypothetical protein
VKIVVIIILLMCLFASLSISAEWEAIGVTGCYFDKSNLRVVSKNVISVSVKIVYSDKEVVRLDDNLRKNGSAYDFSKYGYTIMQEFMNCKDDSTAYKYVIHYDKSGKPITFSEYSDIEYDKVTPNTVGSEMLISICNFASAHNIK